MKQFNFYKPLWRHPVLTIGLMLTILLIVIACGAQSEGNKYVGYIENFHCHASANCEINDDQKIIAPYLPLEVGDQITVYNNHWVMVTLRNGEQKEVKSSNSPFRVPENKESFSSTFFNQIKTLLSDFKKLHQDDMKNPSDCRFPPPQNNVHLNVCSNGQGTMLKAKGTMLKAICQEQGLSTAARNTMLALVMQQEGNWEIAHQLLNGTNDKTEYYPACLLKKELTKTK